VDNHLSMRIMTDQKATPKQANNPLHGVKLKDMLVQLEENYGWEMLATKVNINCFYSNPSISSCLKFLRRTPWAREKVEQLYLELLDKGIIDRSY